MPNNPIPPDPYPSKQGCGSGSGFQNLIRSGSGFQNLIGSGSGLNIKIEI